MATDERFDESVSKWLEESAPARLPERVLNATFERTRRSRQHVGWRAFLGRLSMPRSVPALGSAAVVVVVAALALNYAVNPQGLGGPATPPPIVSPSPAPITGSGGMWPQTSLEEVQEAQEAADAGDPAYTWQVDPRLSSQEWWGYLRAGSEIVERFLREELGWDQFLFNPYQPGDGEYPADAAIRRVVYLRCAPGETNPMYPIAPEGHQEAPGAERCAPTLDEFRYETVSLDLSQPDRRGRDAIWVVSRWAMTAPFTQTDPNVAEAGATAGLEDFLAARIQGEEAEGLVEVHGHAELHEVPLLYATTAGAPYERYEIDVVSRPQWPYGEMEFTVRLFAEGGATVIEQPIYLSHMNGRLTLWLEDTETTENGQPLSVPYEFFDGEVTVSAADPWELSPFFESALALNDQSGDERVELVRVPLPVATGCAQGPAPADADALARAIESDPDLVATAPVRVSVGGAEGLAIEVTVAPGASVCDRFPSTLVLTQGAGYSGPRSPGVDLDQGSRMRLYLIDLPEGSATRILAIAIVAPEARFEAVIEAATPVVDSIEFNAP
jgi:hypothetical protein